MKLAECCRKLTISIASADAADLITAQRQSGRRSDRSFATSATSTVLDTVVAMAATTIGDAIATTATTIAITIGGDEFHSLDTNLHVTSACNLLVYPAKGLGSKAGAFIFYPVHLVNPVILSKMNQ